MTGPGREPVPEPGSGTPARQAPVRACPFLGTRPCTTTLLPGSTVRVKESVDSQFQASVGPQVGGL